MCPRSKYNIIYIYSICWPLYINIIITITSTSIHNSSGQILSKTIKTHPTTSNIAIPQPPTKHEAIPCFSPHFSSPSDHRVAIVTGHIGIQSMIHEDVQQFITR